MPTINGTSGDDTLFGTSGDDVINGFEGNDMLAGDVGVDQTVGGLGDDRHVLDNAGDTIIELDGEGNDTLITSVNYVLAAGVSIETLEMFEFAGAINLTGNELSNTIYGNTSNNIIIGGPAGGAADRMVGSGGDDTYYVNNSADVIDDNLGDNVIYTSVSYSLTPPPATDFPANIVMLAAADPTGITAINLTGNQSSQSIVGNDGNNILIGLGGLDLLSGGAGLDRLDGGDHSDTISGGAGFDILIGGAGTDDLDGGAGNDYYLIASADEHVAAEIHDSGIGSFELDLLIYTATTASTLTLFAGDTGIEQVFVGTEGLDASGTAAINVDASAVIDRINITGNSGANHLIGNAAINLMSGNAGADILEGGGGNDSLDGGTGVDQLYGGTGDDSYTVDSTSDQVFEAAGAGTDWVQAQVSYMLAAGQAVEYLITADQSNGTGSINLTGNELDNNIFGNAAANTLVGGAGNDGLMGWNGDDYLYGEIGNDALTGGAGYDRMYGGVGDDTYMVNDATDFAYENPGEGADTVIASVDHQLRANVENLYLNGPAVIGKGNESANFIAGNELANTLYGYAGDDFLDGWIGDDYLYGGAGNDGLSGGLGYDKMYGGLGDDTYYVNDATDFAYENTGEGTDLVISGVDHQLRDNVENLLLAAGTAVIGRGNDGDNGITGNGLNNRLYGYGGNDTLDGAAGDDVVDGREGNDTLTGGAGYDKMYGGLGDDIFIVGDATDFAYENVGEGNDKVVASVTHTLRANIEELELSGSADIRGYGNGEHNLIIGNSGANLLYGRDGNDSLMGNAGNDLLYGENGDDSLDGGAGQDRFYGGTGADHFIFKDGDFAGPAPDRIMDFSQAEGDLVALGAVDANSGLAGDQAFAFIGSGAFTGTAGQLRTFQAGGMTYVEGDTNGDGTADFLIRIDGLHTLGSGDFIM